MHVPQIIQLAVAGTLKFRFIESTITASGRGTLSSQKGTGQSEAANGRFRYIFHPRTLLQPAWLPPHGFLAPGAQTNGIEFSIKGTERGGAQWFAKTMALRQLDGAPGMLEVEADVDEWWCMDSRSVKTSFVRGVVPGTRLYPAGPQKSGRTRGASVNVRNVTIEFRDHDGYTEILAQSSAVALPSDFVDDIVNALGSVIGKDVHLVYKEEHVDNQRRMCVRSLDGATPATAAELADSAGFWHRYHDELLSRLESARAGASAG